MLVISELLDHCDLESRVAWQRNLSVKLLSYCLARLVVSFNISGILLVVIHVIYHMAPSLSILVRLVVRFDKLRIDPSLLLDVESILYRGF